MKVISSYKEIEELKDIQKELKEELINYYRQITEGIAGDSWQSYTLEDICKIIIIEDSDTIEDLKKFGLKSCNSNIIDIVPEFVEKIVVGTIEMYRVVWIISDSFGISLFYNEGILGQEFDEYIRSNLEGEEF